MKLQIKDSGAWRNVLTFEAGQIDEIKAAAPALLRAAWPGTVMRIADGDQVLEYCEQPACEWRAI